MSTLRDAAQQLLRAHRVVCLTGAGVSAESGIATFRDAQTGLWSRFDPQQLASQAGFAANPGLVWRWYMERLEKVELAVPNLGHLALARLEAILPHFTLVTQNVDNLHEKAGNRSVLHLHGSIARYRCNVCSSPYELRPGDRKADQPPRCLVCGGLIRPDVVWFGELLPHRILDKAWLDSERCDVMLVVGTSSVVYPAAQLPLVAKQAGAFLIEVNPEETPLSELSDVYLQGPSGEIVPQIMDAMEGAAGQEFG